MICQNCNKEIPSGADFCNFCGEKIADEVKKENYTHTIWGKVQEAIDKYETLTLNKITGHWITKTLIVIILLIAAYFGIYADAHEMKFTESGGYKIEYNEDADEYYITSDYKGFALGLYIPRIADQIRYTGYNDGQEPHIQEFIPEECYISVAKDQFSKMTLEMIDNGEVKQTITFRCK